MYITDFEYAGHRLSEYSCIACHVGSSLDLSEIDIGCDITFNTVTNNYSSVRSITSSTYDNVYTTSFEITKDFCNLDADNIYFSPIEVRELIRWLNRREYFKFTPFDLNNELTNISFYGSFNVKPLAYGEHTVALRVEFTGNAPFGYADPIESKFMLLQENEEIHMFGDSDEIITIYPKTSFRCFANGTLKITNQLTGNEIVINNCVSGEIITLDGEFKIIDTDNENHKSTLYNDFNYSYFDILADEYNSENVYTVSIPCEITVSYSPIRKVGVY